MRRRIFFFVSALVASTAVAAGGGRPASGARRVLFVRVGQDEPLFDQDTLRILR